MKLIHYKYSIMRPETVIIIAAVALLFTDGTRCSRSYNQFAKHRNKPREIRGFKPEYLSTAIGFGKRGNIPKISRQARNDDVLLALFQKTFQRFPVEWSTRELQRNQDMAAKLAAILMDGDHNDKISAATFFKPGRTISIQ